MASETSIANLAASKLGDDDQIIDLRSDDTRNARAIAAVYDAMRDAVLRAHPWNFAMTRASLPALSTAPVWGFANRFQLPADFIRFAGTEQDDPGYQIEAGCILTDAAAPLNIRYVARVTDTGRFDDLFVEALACRIAAQVAMRLTGSPSIRDAAMADYKAAIAEAKGADGQENPPETYPEDDWMIAREADW